ncbi:MAG: type II toxin-antitoxin system RelE/ParE family toxin [Catenulisporales bacterium]|jgi:hypothetical protein|nr:type II toxin-antitoxin system RelE/ParE family toxin [Catenulisporales bacterium]
MTWEIVLAPEVEEWYLSLDPQSSDNVTKAIGILEEAGPNLGRPLVDRLHSSKLHNLKELRTPSNNRGHIRILFVFDSTRQAILLVAGDKAGRWRQWYVDAIKLAEERYARYLETPPEEIV